MIVDGRSTSLFKLPADDRYRLLFFCGLAGDLPLKEIQSAADASLKFSPWLKPYSVITGAADGIFQGLPVIIDQDQKMHRTYAAGSPFIYLIRSDG